MVFGTRFGPSRKQACKSVKLQFVKMLQNFNKDGQLLMNICAWLIICVGLVSCIASFFITTPYGRYSRCTWGFGVNAQLAWLLQECPAFFVPFTMFLASDGMQQLKSMDPTPNVLVLLMFMIHYFRRYLRSLALIDIFAFSMYRCFLFCLKADFHSVQFGEHAVFCDHYLLKYVQSAISNKICST